MGRYLVIWEVEKSHVPVDPKERAESYSLLMAMTKQDIEKGFVKEWGIEVGGSRGYNFVEGTEVEIAKMIQQYVPYINVQLVPLATFSQTEEVVNSLLGQ
jgi:hypothetical protein